MTYVFRLRLLLILLILTCGPARADNAEVLLGEMDLPEFDQKFTVVCVNRSSWRFGISENLVGRDFVSFSLDAQGAYKLRNNYAEAWAYAKAMKPGNLDQINSFGAVSNGEIAFWAYGGKPNGPTYLRPKVELDVFKYDRNGPAYFGQKSTYFSLSIPIDGTSDVRFRDLLELTKAFPKKEETPKEEPTPLGPAEPEASKTVPDDTEGLKHSAQERFQLTLLPPSGLNKSLDVIEFKELSHSYLTAKVHGEENTSRFQCPDRVSTEAGIENWPAGCKVGIASYPSDTKERCLSALVPYLLDSRARIQIANREFRSLLGWRLTKSSSKYVLTSPMKPAYISLSEIRLADIEKATLSMQGANPEECLVEGQAEKIQVFRGQASTACFLVRPDSRQPSAVGSVILIALLAPANEMDFYLPLFQYWLAANLATRSD